MWRCSGTYRPLRRCEISPQCFGGPAGSVTRSIALNAPALAESTDVNDVEPELVDELRHGALGVRIVARDRQSSPVRGSLRQSVGGQRRRIDVIEGLDDLRGWQMPLQQLRRRRFLV